MPSGEGGDDDVTSASRTGPQPGSRYDPRAFVYVGLMVIFGSTTAAAARYIVRDLPPIWVPVVRFGVSGLLLLPIVADRQVFARLFRRDWPLLVLAAAMCVPVNQGFFLNAARLGPTSHVGLFYATCPLVVLSLAWTLRLERADLGRLWGVLASVAGVVIIGVGSAWHGGTPPHEVRATILADLLLIGAVLSWGGYLTASKPLVMRHGSLPVLAGTFLVGALLDLPIALVVSPSVPNISRVAPSAWISLAVLTLIITPINLACQNLAMRRLDASQVANFSNLAPILTVIWGAWLFGEAITLSLVVGGALTLAGVFWTGRSRPQRSAADEPYQAGADRRLGDWSLTPAKPHPAPRASSAAG
jgi:drug/metabolite transporter (DMT)-like permease